MNYAVDLGNSLTKIGIFLEDELQEVREFRSVESVGTFLSEMLEARVIIGSVTVGADQLAQHIDPLHNEVMILSSETRLPVKIHYRTPKTLGVDRIAGVVGAMHLFPRRNNLVIDMGTSITYDLVDEEANYFGGMIAPGVAMKFRALHHFTKRLPLIEEVPQEVALTGRSTNEAILSGVINGTVAEVEGVIAKYRQDYSNLNVVLTGGSSSDFESRIKAPIFADSNLVLIGLNQILAYNE